MVDLVDIIQIVIVINWVDGVDELFEVAVEKVYLEGGDDIQIRPGVKIEGDLQQFFIDDSLLVEVVEKAIEYL